MNWLFSIINLKYLHRILRSNLSIYPVWLVKIYIEFVVVQSLCHVWFFVTSWTAAHQAPLSSIISQNLLKFMSIESVMLFNHPILCCPLLLLPSIFPSIRVFSNEWLFTSGGQSVGTLTSASVFPIYVQGWFPLGSTGLMSLQSKALSRDFSSTTVQKHQFFHTQEEWNFHFHTSLWSNSHICIWLLQKS